jgi:hypothetical protein
VADTSERVVLSIPRGDLALSVMRVVTSSFASLHDLPLDRLDDVQLALETLLAEESPAGDMLSLTLSREAGTLLIHLGGLENPDLKDALVADRPFRPCKGCRLDMSIFVGALVDGYSVVEGQGLVFAVDMQKRID